MAAHKRKLVVVLILLTALSLALFGTVSGSQPADNRRTAQESFPDVSSGDWFYTDVARLVSEGIISGYPDNTFRPQGNITRAEFAKMIILAINENSSTASSSFRGVANTYWAKGYIERAKELNIISGYPDGTFRPDGKITRAEIATIVVRAYKFGKTDFGRTIYFDDISRHWAYNNILLASENGIINGYPDNTFVPDGTATRAETAAIVSRALYASEPINADGGGTKTSGSVQLSAKNWKLEGSTISVDVVVKNVGPEAISTNPSGFTLYTTDGSKVSYDESTFDVADLGIGTSESGTIPFVVPAGKKADYILYDYEGIKFPIKIVGSTAQPPPTTTTTQPPTTTTTQPPTLPILSLGETATIDGIEVNVQRVEYNSPEGGIRVYFSVENDSTQTLSSAGRFRVKLTDPTYEEEVNALGCAPVVDNLGFIYPGKSASGYCVVL
ncbi:MAG TPA: S-layer homology domain-containing protein [Anaerolineae bacterium]|nr:S-layer homology domain-containing protein [Anaerolineae bacterium]